MLVVQNVARVFGATKALHDGRPNAADAVLGLERLDRAHAALLLADEPIALLESAGGGPGRLSQPDDQAIFW